MANQATGQTSKLIAIIDDDDSICESLQDLMESAGLVARCFGSAEEFLESGLHRQAACLITDILMPKRSGLQLQARLKEEECDIPIIFITAYGAPGKPPAYAGTDFIVARNGRIAAVYLFFDSLP